MEIKVIWKVACAAAIECVGQGIFEMEEPVEIYVNNEFYKKTDRVVSIIYDLKPETEYEICVKKGNESAKVAFKTEEEKFVYDVKTFGAKGDGQQDDTKYIQAAILSCVSGGRVVIPEGVYKVTSLFLKDNMTLELKKGAVLSADTEREHFPILKSTVHKEDGSGEFILGTWEGDAMDMFAGIIT